MPTILLAAKREIRAFHNEAELELIDFCVFPVKDEVGLFGKTQSHSDALQ